VFFRPPPPPTWAANLTLWILFAVTLAGIALVVFLVVA
jgi:hypothetical protein